jgi:hypothetical protein
LTPNTNIGVSSFDGRRQDHLLRTRIQVLLRAGLVEEQARGLDHDVGADVAPLEVGRVAFLA